MARRMMAGLCLALVLAVFLPVPISQAQRTPNWNRPGVGGRVLGPPPVTRGVPRIRRGNPRLPNYYFDRGGSIAAPKAPLGQQDIASSLRARGFRDIGPMQRRGNTSITEAVGPAGERVQLVIGPNGNIVGVRVLNQGGR